MKNPKFSICIPNYNYGHYIGATINSVLNQTFTDYEIIISDNASTDNSISVIKKIKSEKIRLFQNKYNIGFSHNLDRATKEAAGDYIILLSSDDLMNSNALSNYDKIINSNEYDDVVIMSSYDIIDGAGRTVIAKKPPKPDVVTNYLNENQELLNFNNEFEYEVYRGHLIAKILLSTSFTSAGAFLTTCFAKKLYNDVEGYNNIMSVLPDAHFSHKLCLQNPKIIYSHKSLFKYRVHSPDHAQHGAGINTKILIDLFQMTNSYEENKLKMIRISYSDLKTNFVNYWCIRIAMISLLTGRISKALNNYIFGFVTYPKIMLGNPKIIIILFLFIFSPIFWLLGGLYRRIK